jgi:hypothetical protein
MDKLYIALLNQRTATVIGGHYGLIIGDVRRCGRYFSPQAEIIARMPRDELRTKAQHNVASNHVRYAPMSGRGIEVGSKEWEDFWEDIYASIWAKTHS